MEKIYSHLPFPPIRGFTKVSEPKDIHCEKVCEISFAPFVKLRSDSLTPLHIKFAYLILPSTDIFEYLERNTYCGWATIAQANLRRNLYIFFTTASE